MVAHESGGQSVLDPRLENTDMNMAAGTDQIDSLPASSSESSASNNQKASERATQVARRSVVGTTVRKAPVKATRKRKSAPVSTSKPSPKRQETRSPSSVDSEHARQTPSEAEPGHDQHLEHNENAESRVTRSSSRIVKATTSINVSEATPSKETTKRGRGGSLSSNKKQSEDEAATNIEMIEATESDKENENPEQLESGKTSPSDANKDQEDKIRERDRLVEEAMRMEMMAVEA